MESKLKLPRYRFLGENAFELKKKLEDFEIESVIFDGVTSEPTDIMVEEGCILYQANQCDFLIGFGGGSQLDTAEALVSKLSRDYDLDINIIFGNIELIHEYPIGGLVAIVNGDDGKIDKALHYLQDKNVGVEVIADGRTA